MIPLATEFTKTIPPTCGEAKCRGYLAYVPELAVVMEACLSLSVGLLMTAALSGRDGLAMCFRAERLAQTAPVAFFYAAGDLVQLMAIGATSATFFLIVGQTKLL